MKLKYILPVATIASVATAITPLAVSCGSNTIQLDTMCHGSSPEWILAAKEARSFKKDKTYNISAILKYWDEEQADIKVEEATAWFFFITDFPIAQGCEPLIIDENVTVSIDGKEQKRVNESPNEGEFLVDIDDEGTTVRGKFSNFTKSSVVKISIKSLEDKDNQNCYFAIIGH